MKIELNSVNRKYTNYRPNNDLRKTDNNQKYISSNIELNTYPAVYFCARIAPKGNNGIVDSDKLLTKLDDILKLNTNDTELTLEELIQKSFDYIIKFMKRKTQRRSALENEFEFVTNNKNLNGSQKYSEACRIRKELINLEKEKPVLPNRQKSDNRDKSSIDFVLINKFKTALLNENFDFEKIFKQYYSELNNIKTLSELKEKFPNIHIPRRPEEVVAQKIENSLTRDFYEKINEYNEVSDFKGRTGFISETLYSTFENLFKNKSQESKNKIYDNVSIPTVKQIRKRLELINDEGLSSIPQFRKQKPILSETDYLLLDVNYDDFVLTVLKEQYLNFKRINDIVYSKDGFNIKLSSVKDKDYCFEKIPSKIIDLMKDAEALKKVQRDYNKYTNEQFQKRLEYYADLYGENDDLLEKIIDFANCKYTQEDTAMLKQFLKEIDDVFDGKQSMENALTNIKNKKIHPTGTVKIDAEQRLKALELQKESQKKYEALKAVQKEFDEYINLLYKNNLSYLAEICSGFRPTSIDKKEIYNANHIIELIKKNSSSSTHKLNNSKLEIDITRWNKYTEYAENEPNSEILALAKKFALDEFGNVDTNKAGKYLINAEALDIYPQSIEFARDKELFKEVVKNSGNDKDTIIRNICKYDDYLDLDDKKKTYIKEILNIFGMKNDFDKNILKYIIKNHYIKADTTNLVRTNNPGSKEIYATIGAAAKNSIYEKYKFPKCVELFEDFEDALSKFATSKQSSGIKHIGRNNKSLKDVYELKIIGYPDRVFAYDGYYFNDYSAVGTH